ncbi:SDR family oxidoreductase [Streptomyces sp. NPDC088341]|uniref:SDR family oxidoreductase n=1 Tax=Streptomyces sp. NPDC088341 TaxID=3154870 RepID=UPI00342085EC
MSGWGARGARINAISPGHIATPMGDTESGGANGAIIQAMIDGSNAKREGTPADIARAAAFLLSPGARFISGSDMLVDGGVIAATPALRFYQCAVFAIRPPQLSCLTPSAAFHHQWVSFSSAAAP